MDAPETLSRSASVGRKRPAVSHGELWNKPPCFLISLQRRKALKWETQSTKADSLIQQRSQTLTDQQDGEAAGGGRTVALTSLMEAL